MFGLVVTAFFVGRLGPARRRFGTFGGQFTVAVVAGRVFASISVKAAMNVSRENILFARIRATIPTVVSTNFSVVTTIDVVVTGTIIKPTRVHSFPVALREELAVDHAGFIVVLPVVVVISPNNTGVEGVTKYAGCICVTNEISAVSGICQKPDNFRTLSARSEPGPIDVFNSKSVKTSTTTIVVETIDESGIA
jgi:hypothetical protein